MRADDDVFSYVEVAREEATMYTEFFQRQNFQGRLYKLLLVNYQFKLQPQRLRRLTAKYHSFKEYFEIIHYRAFLRVNKQL